MITFLRGIEPHAYAALRAVAGFLFVFHGLQKFGFFGGRMVDMLSLLGLAAIIETLAGALVALGLFTVPVAFIASGEMATAYFMAHQPRGAWPIENGGEPAALYCVIFFYIATRGSGSWALDRAKA